MLAGRRRRPKPVLGPAAGGYSRDAGGHPQRGETGGALGAARLACLAAGKPLAAVCEKPEVWQTWRTTPARHQALMQRYAQFKALYLNDLNYRQR